MAKATWNGAVLAESERTVVVEGNPCPSPRPAARRIKDDVACWHGVKVRRAARA